MADLPGDAATARQRLDQARIAYKIAREAAQRFSTLQPHDPAGQRNFIDAMAPRILAANRESARLARTYAATMSALESGSADDVDLADPPALEAIRASLRVTGPIALTQKVNRIQTPANEPNFARQVKAAKQEAQASVAGAAVRHTLAGGRDTIEQYANDPKPGQRIRGYVRITRMDDKVCYFCAMLASRANYLQDSFELSDAQFMGPGDAKVHDACRCILRPMYGSVLPDSVVMYREAWKQMSGGDKDPIKNFRSNWTKRDSDWFEKVA